MLDKPIALLMRTNITTIGQPLSIRIYPSFALCTSFPSLFQQFNDNSLRYCVLQILSILIFLNSFFLFFSRS